MRYLFILTILLGCSSPIETASNVLRIAGEEARKVDLSTFVEQVGFQPLFITGSSFPGEIDKVLLTDKYVFVIDRSISSKLYAFDRDTGMEVKLPILYGDGPGELSKVSDFTIDKESAYVLDGSKQVLLKFSLKNDFENLHLSKIPFSASRLAKGKECFYFVADSEMVIFLTDENFKVVEQYLDKNIAHLSKPINSFHVTLHNGNERVLFHSLFDNQVYIFEGAIMKGWKRFDFGKNTFKLENHPISSYPMDIEGYNAFYAMAKPYNSHFTLFEATNDAFVLLHFKEDNPKFTVGGTDNSRTVSIENLNNNITFESFIPKITGTYNNQFLAIIARDEVQTTTNGFEASGFAKVLKDHPKAELFLATMTIRHIR